MKRTALQKRIDQADKFLSALFRKNGYIRPLSQDEKVIQGYNIEKSFELKRTGTPLQRKKFVYGNKLHH